jgi:BASS family bile acid:Na+ symporter
LAALGFGLTRALTLPSEIAAWILLLAACPVGDIANVYTLLARANVALSVTVNALSILLAAGTMALIFEAYNHLLGAHFVFEVPTPTLLGRLLLVLPVLVGSSLRRLTPGFAKTHAKSVHGASVAGIACLLMYVMMTQRERLAAKWQQTAVVAAGFLGLALLAGLAFASAIAITLLNHIEYAVFAIVYFLTEVAPLLGVVVVYRCGRAQAVPQADLSRNPQ